MKAAATEVDPVIEANDIQVLEQIISALVVSQIVTVNVLHTQGTLDRQHFAHAFARAADRLSGDSENRLLGAILAVMKSAFMVAENGGRTDVHSWLRGMLDSMSAPGNTPGH